MPGPNIRDVACYHCGAAPEVECTTMAGHLARDPHRSRWNALRQMRNNHLMIVEILKADDRLGLTAGEQYLAQTYWLDPGAKVSLLARIGDGHDPSCNQYWHSVRFIRWATVEETATVAA